MSEYQVYLKGKNFKTFFGWVRANESRTASILSGKRLQVCDTYWHRPCSFVCVKMCSNFFRQVFYWWVKDVWFFNPVSDPLIRSLFGSSGVRCHICGSTVSVVGQSKKGPRRVLGYLSNLFTNTVSFETVKILFTHFHFC